VAVPALLCRAWCRIARRSVSPPHWHARIPYRPTLGVSRIAGKSGCCREFRYCNWDRLSYRPCNPVPPRALCHLRAPLMKKHRDFILRCPPAICFRVFAWTTSRITGDNAQRSVGHWCWCVRVSAQVRYGVEQLTPVSDKFDIKIFQIVRGQTRQDRVVDLVLAELFEAVQAPTKFEFVVNLRTAKTLGLTAAWQHETQRAAPSNPHRYHSTERGQRGAVCASAITRAVSVQDAALPSPTMNSRRLIQSPRQRWQAALPESSAPALSRSSG